MIYLGLDDDAKAEVVDRYCAEHGVQKVFVFSPARFRPSFAPDHMDDPTAQCDGRRGLYVDWPDIILYRYYYKLLQEVDANTLVVVNECLRAQNRHDLTYNCLRNYLNQTPHALVFQYLPIIDDVEDFMVLFDLATKSRWRRERFQADLIRRERVVRGAPAPVEVVAVPVPVDDKVRTAYAREKAKLLAEVRADPDKDPHVLPRNLLLVGGKAKLAHVAPDRAYVGRNNRFKLPHLATYKAVEGAEERTAFELPHNFLDFTDFLAVTRQRRVEVLVADTKADHWYFRRFQDWTERLRDAQAAIHG